MIDKMPLYRNVRVGDKLVKVPGLENRRAAEVDLAGPVPYDKRYQGWEVPISPEPSSRMSNMLETIGKGEAMKGKVIPGYNEGGMPMEDDDIMNFIKTYQGNLGDVNPENVAASIISDEELLQNSSDVGANSFAEAGVQQFNNPRLSVPIPGADYGMTDSAQLRGGNVRPDMMPPGYTPPAETYPNYMPPQSERYKDDVRYNVDQELLSSVVPPKFNLDSTEVPIGNGLVPYSNYTESGSLDPRVDPNFTGKVVDGMVISSDEPNAVKIPLDMYDHERGCLLYTSDAADE